MTAFASESLTSGDCQTNIFRCSCRLCRWNTGNFDRLAKIKIMRSHACTSVVWFQLADEHFCRGQNEKRSDCPATPPLSLLGLYPDVIRSVSYSDQNFAILIASTAHSQPLLPSLPPLRSRACSMSFVVSRPKIIGTSLVALSLAIPAVTP